MSDLFDSMQKDGQEQGQETESPDLPRPLADRLRPETLEGVVGQEHLIGQGKALRKMAESGRISSMILWGPPGTGKTTIARILSQYSAMHFEQISAIFSGVKDLRSCFDSARIRCEIQSRCLQFKVLG